MGRLVSLGQWEQHEALLPHSQSGGGKKALSRGIILCQTTGKRKSGKDRVTLACDGEGVNYWRTASGTSSINKQLPEAAWGREALYSTSEAESTAGIFKSLKKKISGNVHCVETGYWAALLCDVIFPLFGQTKKTSAAWHVNNGNLTQQALRWNHPKHKPERYYRIKCHLYGRMYCLIVIVAPGNLFSHLSFSVHMSSLVYSNAQC